MQIASFEKRLLAFIIDYGIGIAIGILLYIFVFNNLLGWHIAYSFLVVFLTVFLYYVSFVSLMTYLTNGYTIGNFIVRIKMVSIKFQRLSYRQIIVKYIPLSLLPCCAINAVYMLLKHTEKTIFDELSHTVSISIR